LLAWLYWAAFAYIRHELADPNIPRHGRMASIDPWQVYFKNLFSFFLSLSFSCAEFVGFAQYPSREKSVCPLP
jgi:hypothetical protein